MIVADRRPIFLATDTSDKSVFPSSESYMETPAPATAPILVLGLGNTLLSDDGLGPVLVERVRNLHRDTTTVECLDGGTQGLALLGRLAGRRALVILDAFALGKIPGTVTVLEGVDVLRNGGPRSTTAHEGNAGELLAAGQFLGD